MYLPQNVVFQCRNNGYLQKQNTCWLLVMENLCRSISYDESVVDISRPRLAEVSFAYINSLFLVLTITIILHTLCTFSITSFIHHLWFITDNPSFPFLFFVSFLLLLLCACACVLLSFFLSPKTAIPFTLSPFGPSLLGISCVWLIPPGTPVFPFIPFVDVGIGCFFVPFQGWTGSCSPVYTAWPLHFLWLTPFLVFFSPKFLLLFSFSSILLFFFFLSFFLSFYVVVSKTKSRNCIIIVLSSLY